jgi:outer membrane lipoprotein-sorting protein
MALCGCGLSGALAEAVPGVLHTWLAAQKRTGDVRVEFGITKTLPALKEPVKSSGRFWNYADGRFLWETGKPPTAVLRYDGVTLDSWQAETNQWQKLDPNQRAIRLWMDFLSGKNLTEENLLRQFLITAPAAGKSTASVILEPKSKRERRDLKQLELKFDTAGQRLLQIVVWQGDGGSQMMDFKEPKRMTAADRGVVPPPARN